MNIIYLIKCLGEILWDGLEAIGAALHANGAADVQDEHIRHGELRLQLLWALRRHRIR